MLAIYSYIKEKRLNWARGNVNRCSAGNGVPAVGSKNYYVWRELRTGEFGVGRLNEKSRMIRKV